MELNFVKGKSNFVLELVVSRWKNKEKLKEYIKLWKVCGKKNKERVLCMV